MVLASLAKQYNKVYVANWKIWAESYFDSESFQEWGGGTEQVSGQLISRGYI